MKKISKLALFLFLILPSSPYSPVFVGFFLWVFFVVFTLVYIGLVSSTISISMWCFFFLLPCFVLVFSFLFFRGEGWYGMV